VTIGCGRVQRNILRFSHTRRELLKTTLPGATAGSTAAMTETTYKTALIAHAYLPEIYHRFIITLELIDKTPEIHNRGSPIPDKKTLAHK
jgi:hypothetical protein